MNNIYTILGLGLLSAAALSSCQQEEIFKGENNGKLPEGTLSTIATISDYAPENGNSRANVQEDGKTFYWNTDDKVTIWDGTKGIEFSAKNYNEAKPSNNVEFTAEGEFADGATVWGIYPSKGSEVTADNVFSFTLPAEVTQNADGKPHLNKTMFMMAEGKVNGQTVTNLNFKHLTSVFHFSIKNGTSYSYKINSIEVKVSNADGTEAANVFPTELKINGTEKTYSNMSNTLSLKLDGDKTLSYSETATAYLSFFPSQGLTGDSKLKIVAKVNKNSAAEESELVLKEGKISELYAGQSLATTDNYNYVEGKRYGVTSLIYDENDPGYTSTEDNVYTIITAQGLANLIKENKLSSATTVTLQNDIDLNDIQGGITPIATFTGTFDGNNKTISNLTISNTTANSDGIGLFAENSGTIKNLCIKNAEIRKDKTINTDKGVGVLAGVNKGKIENCTMLNPTITVSNVTKTSIGGLVGVNTGSGNITGCAVTSVDGNNTAIKLESTVAADKNPNTCDLGGLAGKSQSPISYSYVGSNVKINYNATAQPNSNIGGLIGFSNNTTIEGCYAKATITSTATAAVSIGGLIGSAWTASGATTTVKCSYSAGSINTQAGGTIGTFIGHGGGVGTKNIKYCYTSTTKSHGNDFLGSTGGTITASYSYFISNADATDIDTGYKAITVATIKSKVATFNSGLGWSGYEFAANESNTEPLIIKKKAQE